MATAREWVGVINPAVGGTMPCRSQSGTVWRGTRVDGRGEGHAIHAGIADPKQLVGPVLDPLRHVGISWAAVGWVVLESAILGGIVRWGDHDAVREVLLAAAVVDEDGARNDR